MVAPLAGRVDLAPAQGDDRLMAEWIYFIHPPREDFADTMTDEEQAVWGVHFERFERALADGTLILVGPTLGSTNTGIAIFEADDEADRADASWTRTRSSPAGSRPVSCGPSACRSFEAGTDRRALTPGLRSTPDEATDRS